MSDSQNSERQEQHVADMDVIYRAGAHLRAMKRTLHLLNLKRARRIGRVQVALRALKDVISEIETAQVNLTEAQKANDRAYLDAATHALESDSTV